MRSICQPRCWLALGVLMAAALGGCARSDRKVASSAPAESVEHAPAVVEAESTTGPPVSDPECLAFAKTIEDATQWANSPGFSPLIEWGAVLKTATRGISVQEASRKGFIQGVKSSMQQEQGFVPQIADAVKRGGSYR